jgi:hypothetical protein
MRRTDVFRGSVLFPSYVSDPNPSYFCVPLVEEILDEAERHFPGLSILRSGYCVRWGSCLLVKIKNIPPTNVTMEDIAVGA